MAKTEARYASNNPESFVEGGLPQGLMTVTQVRWTTWDYQGKVAVKVPASMWTYKEQDGTEYTQYYSAGDLKRVQPSDDGKHLMLVGEGVEGIVKNTNHAILMDEWVAAGFPQNRIEDDITVFEGAVAEMIQKPAKEREGLTSARREDGRQKMMLVPAKVVTLPWEAKGKKKGVAATTTVTAGTPATDELVARGLGLVAELLAGKDAITRQELASTVFNRMGADPTIKAVGGVVFRQAFVDALAEAGYELKGETITAKA